MIGRIIVNENGYEFEVLDCQLGTVQWDDYKDKLRRGEVRYYLLMVHLGKPGGDNSLRGKLVQLPVNCVDGKSWYLKLD